MPAQEVADSTDWLSTPLSGLAAVEAALRCQVCKDFYRTPMITTCSHTFCSICIRRALSSDGKCPLCRAAEQELKLRSNWSMEETVEAFSKARDAVLEVARGARKRETTPKRKSDEGETSSQPESKRVRTSARLSSRAEQQPPPPPPPPVDVVEDSEDDEYVPEDPDGLVPCPSCQKKMKAWQVFQHLESCPGPTEESQPDDASTLGQQQRKQQRTYDRLPALNYSMFKEQALRKKLGEMGISNQGPRHLLERRHREWLTIWNANCDAATPKRRNELLHDLDVWERTQGGKAPTMGKAVQNAAIIKDKEFDGAAWATKHDSSFKDLITNARKSRLEAKKKAEENKEEPAPNSNGENHTQDTEMANADGQQNEEPTSGELVIPRSPPQISSIPTQTQEPGAGQ